MRERKGEETDMSCRAVWRIEEERKGLEGMGRRVR